MEKNARSSRNPSKFQISHLPHAQHPSVHTHERKTSFCFFTFGISYIYTLWFRLVTVTQVASPSQPISILLSYNCFFFLVLQVPIGESVDIYSGRVAISTYLYTSLIYYVFSCLICSFVLVSRFRLADRSTVTAVASPSRRAPFCSRSRSVRFTLDPFLPYVRAHSSHITPLNALFELLFVFLSLDPFLPYVRAHSSHIPQI